MASVLCSHEMRHLIVALVLIGALLVCTCAGAILLMGPSSHTPQCVTPFGSIIGTDPSSGVTAYSNCANTYVSNLPNYVENGTVYSGMQWQCVEYGRRYLITTLSVTFGSVDNAFEIFDLPTVNPLGTSAPPRPFLSWPNGVTTTPPAVGCLLIYGKQLDGVTGHVAVIVYVAPNLTYLRVAEQNWDNAAWNGRGYSRELTVAKTSHGVFAVNDDEVLGWKCVASTTVDAAASGWDG